MSQTSGKRKSLKRIRLRNTPDEEEVGYGKPPRAHQFKPGQSGNPKGRPKGTKNEATILQELLQHPVTLNERGKTRKISLLEAILRKIADDGLKGNIKAAVLLLNRYQASASGEAPQQDLGEDDKAVLEEYIRGLQSKSDSGEEQA